jgi:hypothetical protein
LGVDFTAVLDHRLGWEELHPLPAALNGRWAAPAELVDFRTGQAAPATEWRWRLSPGFSDVAEELFAEGYVDLRGPCYFGASVFKRALEVTNLARWHQFILDPHMQRGLLAGVRSTAAVLRATTIIYLPDSAFAPSAASDLLYDGAGIVDVVTWLERHVGPAMPIAEERCEVEEEWWEHAYFLERL